MSEPEFPLCDAADPRIPVFVNMLRKSVFMGGNFTIDARRILAALDGMEFDPLRMAVEVVLLDHADEIDGDKVDPNIAELAYVYRQRTGWTVNSEGPRCACGEALMPCTGCREGRCYSCDPEGSHAECDATAQPAGYVVARDNGHDGLEIAECWTSEDGATIDAGTRGGEGWAVYAAYPVGERRDG